MSHRRGAVPHKGRQLPPLRAWHPRSLFPGRLLFGLALAAGTLACGGRPGANDSAPPLDSTARVASVTGLVGPEAVRYDPDQDVYFVSNLGGGFISRVSPDGTVDSLHFMVTADGERLQSPRGQFLTGDTLWVADSAGVHAFHRLTGAHLGFVSFRGFAPGFLNDIAQGPDGALYVTDTGEHRVYRLAAGQVTIAVEGRSVGSPNGITWDTAGGRFVIAPWDGRVVRGWTPGAGGVTDLGRSTSSNCDGVEVVGGRVILACQADSTIQVLTAGRGQVVIRLPGQPADIGIDTRRGRIAVPYIDLDRVDIWALPAPR